MFQDNTSRYTPVRNSAVEEDDIRDLEAGPSSTSRSGGGGATRLSPKTLGKRRVVAWDAGASELAILHPNIQKEDRMHEEEGEGEESTDDGEVPPSFKVEATAATTTTAPHRRHLPPKLPAVTTKTAERPESSSLLPSSSARQRGGVMRGLDDYEKALWNWVNVYNLDAFLQEAYYYYEGNGIYSIALDRGLNLLTVGFVIGFSTFLLGCINYSGLRHEKHSKLSDVIIPQCVSRFSGFTLLLFLLFTAFYVWQIISFVLSLQKLFDMYNFYTHLLKIPDADIQTISWSEVVRRISAIREDNPLTALSSKNARKADNVSTAKLDAHDIANRIMRQENYLIALFNKELLDLRVPLPTLLKPFMAQEEGKGRTLTQALEWNLRFCLMEYLFDSHGKVRKVFLKAKHRTALIDGLRRRFIFLGILNAIFAPFIVLYLLMYSFFKYFEQYHKDPSSIGSRRYTLFAQWKFREFNELPHIFARRLDQSYRAANKYIGQFPNEKITHLMRFVSFVASSFAAVLLLASVLDPDLFLNFEITSHRTVFFYLGVFGAFLTVTRGAIPEENRVFDSEGLMMEVIAYTHYMPKSWKGQLHSKQVHQEFGKLFALKILIFFHELVSVILTPFVLWFSLPDCAPAIIDFFREFSVHVDGRGYVCSFAEFNFERHGNVKFGGAPSSRKQDKKMVSNEGKMEKSFLNFKAANPDWMPSDPSGSMYLTRMTDLNSMHRYRRRHMADAVGIHHNHRDFMNSASGGNAPIDSSHMTERAQEYDHGLRQSRTGAAATAAAHRRRSAGSGGVVPAVSAGSILSMSTLLATEPPPVGGGGGASVFVDPNNAPSVTLGDSHHASEEASTKPWRSTQRKKTEMTGAHPQPDVVVVGPDEGVESNLGESYVDGARQYGIGGEDEDEDGIEDGGGVLELLAQIYGRKDAPSVGF